MIIAFFQKELQVRIGIFFLLSTLAMLGFWLRIRNLGELGLIMDEGVQALAVQGILKYGIPKVDSGLIYSHALSFLYSQAATAKLFELNEFWLRFPSVLFGVATIFPSYILAKTLFNRRVGLLTAAIMTFSVWEIELSRYARFYTAFQFMYLVSLICFYRGFMLEHRNHKIWFSVAAFITFSTHYLSRVLVTCFLIPLLSNSFKLARKFVFGFLAVCMYGMWMLYNKLVWRFDEFGDPLSPIKESQRVSLDVYQWLHSIVILRLPDLPDLSYFVQTVHKYPTLFTILGLALVAATFYLIYQSIQQENEYRGGVLAISMLWAAFIHQFGIALIILVLYLFLCVRSFRILLAPPLKVVYGVVAVCLSIWISIMVDDPAMTSEQIIMVMFGYPNIIGYFLYRFITGWPIVSIVFGLGSILLLARFIRNRNDQVPLFVLGAIFLPVVLTSFFFRSPSSRYFFHLYPLIVMVFSMIVIKAGSRILRRLPLKRQWVQNFGTSAMFSAILFISQDANPFQAWNISNRTYQSSKDQIRGITNLMPYAGFHQDQKTPSLYVRERLSPGDRVVAFGPIFRLQVFHFYIGKVDYIVDLDLTHAKSRGGKLINSVTGSEILNSLPKIKQILEESPGGVWILGDRMLLCEEKCHGFVGCGDALIGPCWHFYHQPVREYLRSLVHDPDYVGLDGQTFAVKVR